MFIKGFDENLRCRDYQFEVGKVYDTGADEEKLELCSNTVFHFCRNLEKVHNHYSANPKENNRFCEIEVLGRLVEDEEKCGSNKIKIVREITGQELANLRGFKNGNTGLFNTGDCNTGKRNTGNRNTGDCNTGDCNTGNRNTGYWNTGNWNTGDCNTGDWNTGNWNTGDCNTGDRNTGKRNTGNRNTGDCNTGDCNTGNRNTGYWNTGNWNTGDCNTGDWNTGNWNTGDCNTGDRNTGKRNTGNRNTGDCNTGKRNTGNRNTGDWNTGNRNTGYWNTGDWNTGDCNTGDCNTGDRNTGDWNTCNRSTGLFNTEERTITIFNKDSGLTWNEVLKKDWFCALNHSYFKLTEWIYYTEEEKENSPIRKAIGGYLKKYTFKEACENWWNSLDEIDRKLIQTIPNFDKSIFKEITGIEV
jgi:hypothetical protein